MEWNHLCNFGRWNHEEPFNKIILNLDQWFRRYCLSDSLPGALVAPSVQRSRTFCEILVEVIMGNIHVK